MGASYDKGLILYRQRRWRDAAEYFRQELAANPGTRRASSAHAMLALSLVHDRKIEAGHEEAKIAIATDPQAPFPHYAMAHVILARARAAAAKWTLRQRQRPAAEVLRAARDAVNEAVRLQPWSPDFLELKSRLEFDLGNRKASLDALKAGLAIDPRHIGCLHMRTFMLNHTGSLDDAMAELDRALETDPNDVRLHRQRSWMLLQKGDHRAARVSFQAALHLDPNDRRTQIGLQHAKAARIPPYRWMLQLLLWSHLLSNRSALMLAVFAAAFMIGAYRDMLRVELGTAFLLAFIQFWLTLALARLLVPPIRTVQGLLIEYRDRLRAPQAPQAPRDDDEELRTTR